MEGRWRPEWEGTWLALRRPAGVSVALDGAE